MAKLEQLKRSILDQAVTENVDLIAGRRPTRPSRRSVPPGLRALVAALSVGLAAASGALVWEKLPWDRTAAAGAPVDRADLALSSRAASGGSLGPAGHGGGPAREQPITASALGLAQGEDGGTGAPEATDHRLAETVAPPPEERLYDAPSRIDPAILPLGVRRVVLDPGHGGPNPGTVASGLLEKELTLDIALRLEQLLAGGGFEVALTREDDRHVELADRVAFANRERGDLFVSIHVNWLGSTAGRGIETFYLGPTDDPILEQLAHVENRSSGYSLTDFRTLLDGIYADARRDVSRDLASSIHNELVRHLRKVSPNLRDRGVKTAPFVVLIGTEMPAVLAEVSCLSSDEEIELLQEPSYRQQIAEALHAGIASYARSLETTSPSLGETTMVAGRGGRGP